MSYRLASRTLAVALSSSLLLLSVGAGMSVATSPTTPVKPSIQGGGPGGGGDDESEDEGNEGVEHAAGSTDGKSHKEGGRKKGAHAEGHEGTATGGGLVNKAAPTPKASGSANLKQGTTTKVTPKVAPSDATKVAPKVSPKSTAKKPSAQPIVKPTSKASAKPKVASA